VLALTALFLPRENPASLLRKSILIAGAFLLSSSVAAAQVPLPGRPLHPRPASAATSAGSSILPDRSAPDLSLRGDPFSESDSISISNFNWGRRSVSLSADSGVATENEGYVPLNECPTDRSGARECRIHWHQLLISSALFNAFQNAGNLYSGYWYRYETTTGKWFQRWFDSDLGWRWNQWSDGNPFMDDYIGHPMMGSITNYLWIQNDPRGATVEIGSPGYWRSRWRALVFSTAYSFEWKFGPFGEAGVGHNGDHITDTVNGQNQNDTGDVELVTTPVGGLLWTMAEDELDKHVVKRLEEKPRGPGALFLISFLTPSRATANILRFRPPWYRDSRIVKANSFWSDSGPGVSATTADAVRDATHHPSRGAAAYLRAVEPITTEGPPVWQGPGGRHEFGAWWGLSLISGHIWGYSGGVKYMPIDLRYSYEFYRHRQEWTMRYSPELTALAMLDWPTPQKPVTHTNQRQRVYGSGLSPVGFQCDFGPLHRVQPFISGDGGFIYFANRVLSPEGSQFMYTVDYGVGLNIFHHKNQAITIGYRYQHLSNGDISMHNPGTDANDFYVGVSRFRTKGDRRTELDLH
jgi:hypothetical protein